MFQKFPISVALFAFTHVTPFFPLEHFQETVDSRKDRKSKVFSKLKIESTQIMVQVQACFDVSSDAKEAIL